MYLAFVKSNTKNNLNCCFKKKKKTVVTSVPATGAQYIIHISCRVTCDNDIIIITTLSTNPSPRS